MALPARMTGFRASFRFRLFTVFTLISAVITIVFSSLYIVFEINKHQQIEHEKLHLLATHLAEKIRLPLYAENREELRKIAGEMARYSEILAVVIITGDGRVLCEYRRTAVPSPGEVMRESVEVHSNPLGIAPDTAILGLDNQSDILIGRVVLEHDSSEMAPMIRRLIVTAAGMGFVFWVTISSICYLALRQVTRSFNTLMQGIDTVRSGDYSHRIAVISEDEPGLAAVAVNELATTLQLRDEQNRLLHEELVNALKLEIREEKKQLMAKLIQTNRMTSLGLLASSMAHEINTPNGAIKLAGQQLAKVWKDTVPILDRVAVEEGDFILGGIVYSQAREGIAKSTDIVSRCSERIEQVIQDLRAYNVGDHEMLETLDVNKAVSDALVIVKSRGYRGDIEITRNLRPELPMVHGNSHQLAQVVINLLLNAIQAVPDGKNGAVSVETDFDISTGEVGISVKDNGEGVPAELLKNLTEPFYSTRLKKGGSGLGLYISNFIVLEHKGRLEFASEPGEGTSVTIRIPAMID
jgi:two-component system NtrC family sensor kinase